MADTEPNQIPRAGKAKRLAIRGGHRAGASDPIEITPSGDVVGLGETQILDKQGKPVASCLYGRSLSEHIAGKPSLDTTDPNLPTASE